MRFWDLQLWIFLISGLQFLSYLLHHNLCAVSVRESRLRSIVSWLFEGRLSWWLYVPDFFSICNLKLSLSLCRWQWSWVELDYDGKISNSSQNLVVTNHSSLASWSLSIISFVHPVKVHSPVSCVICWITHFMSWPICHHLCTRFLWLKVKEWREWHRQCRSKSQYTLVSFKYTSDGHPLRFRWRYQHFSWSMRLPCESSVPAFVFGRVVERRV